MVSQRITAIACCLGLCLFTVGCSGDSKLPVEGTVTWNGEPIPKGSISFFSVDPSVGPDAGPIENGRFSFRASPGEKRVEIFADREVGKPDPVMNTVRREQYIPARYNEETELRAEISTEGPNEFQFDLVAKNSAPKAGS